jgi:hypothetical protein
MVLTFYTSSQCQHALDYIYDKAQAKYEKIHMFLASILARNICLKVFRNACNKSIKAYIYWYAESHTKAGNCKKIQGTKHLRL